MKLSPLALPRRVSLAVVARDASNPSTGLLAKQQIAGAERFERPSSVLETERLTIVLNGHGLPTGSCAGFYSHGRIGHLRTFELPARVVGHSGIEPEMHVIFAPILHQNKN